MTGVAHASNGSLHVKCKKGAFHYHLKLVLRRVIEFNM